MPKPRLSDEERKQRIKVKNALYYAKNKEKWAIYNAPKSPAEPAPKKEKDEIQEDLCLLATMNLEKDARDVVQKMLEKIHGPGPKN